MFNHSDRRNRWSLFNRRGRVTALPVTEEVPAVPVHSAAAEMGYTEIVQELRENGLALRRQFFDEAFARELQLWWGGG